MVFMRELRSRVIDGTITRTVRIWTRPHVKVGGKYKFESGWLRVTSMHEIALADITPAIARQSGFNSVVEMLKVAKHGAGRRIYLIDFHYVPAGASARSRPGTQSKSCVARRLAAACG